MNLPPWLTPSDPAPAVLRGFSIGAELGSREAARRFQEMQMARAEQEDAMQQARWEAEMNLKAAETAQKHQAQMAYAKALESGVDPLDALIKYGPAMGNQASAEAAAIRSKYQQQKQIPTWKKMDFDGSPVLMSSDGRVVNLPKPPTPDQWTVQNETDSQGNPYRVLLNTRTQNRKLYPSPQNDFYTRTFVERSEENELLKDLDAVQYNLNKLQEGPLFQRASNKKEKDLSDIEKGLLAKYRQMSDREAQLRSQISTIRQQLQNRPAQQKLYGGRFTEGQTIKNSETGELFTIQNGVPVSLDSEGDEDF